MTLKKISIVLLIVVLSGTLLLAATACNKDTGDSLERVLQEGKLTVVGSGGYPPFNYFDEEGNVVGFDVDVGKAIAERLGVELDYITSDWDGLVEGLRSKRYDAILGSMAITPERLAVVSFTNPYYYSGAQLVVRKDSGIATPADIENKEIAVVTGTNFVGDAEGLGATVSLYQDDFATLNELINGRVDGVITDRLVALGAMEKINGGENLKLCGEILRLEVMGIAINRDDTTLLARINEIIEDMRKDGTLREISEKWHNGADITER